MSQIRNLQIYCSCGKKNLFQQVCLNKSCRATNRVYCLKCDKRNEHFTCQYNVKDEEGLIQFFEDIGKKMEIYILNLQESLRKIVEGFNELTKTLRNKCQYNKQRLQELNEQDLKNIIDQIFQFQDEFEKGLEEEMQNCSKNMLIKLNNWIDELRTKSKNLGEDIIIQRNTLYRDKLQEQKIQRARTLKQKIQRAQKLKEEIEKQKRIINEKTQQLFFKQATYQDQENQIDDRYIEYHPSHDPNLKRNRIKKEKEAQLGRPIMEILIEFIPDPTIFNRDPNITTIQNKFKIFSIELNQKAFEKNIITIEKIQIPNDYTVKHQYYWTCIRTLKPIVFSQLKDVYLMKRADSFQDEVYILKMPIGGQPYKSMNEAMKDCRSHLISKRYMQKFIEELNDKGCNTPPIKYQDLLILQEDEKSFFIAERFFEGEFIEFNNKYGYINDNTEKINALSQVFTYYTYFKSDFNYLICNVQGVGYNFTDPSINTIGGDFDDNDFGAEGQMGFLINYEYYKDKFKEYLKILDIYE
ncbi:unnamed protein product [Paramecium primaurelia]|uniref:Alpha-type protein kinase domain-containing protein n=1 Tax=Paramecium primaurelia TaxID=5886 RepID=A0A8S1QL22_PARPR|nr:unnamed protein product [Paramecium primaurelia]